MNRDTRTEPDGHHSSSVADKQQELWLRSRERLGMSPTAADYSQAYDEINSFLRLHGDPAKHRQPDGTVYGRCDLAGHWEKRIVLALVGQPGRKVLEIGCGDGQLAVALARSGALVKGVDISAVAVRTAQGLAAQQGVPVAFAVESALVPDEPADCYDYVVSIDVVEHLNPADVPAHLRAVWKRLKAGSAYVLSLPFFGEEEDPLHLGNYRPAEIRAMLRSCGFVPELAPLVCYARTGNLELIRGEARTTRSRIVRGLCHLPAVGGMISRILVRHWYAHLNFFVARKLVS